MLRWHETVMNYAHDEALLHHKLQDEAGRLLALRRYGVLESGRERNFEGITDLVRDLFKVPICAISLVDDQRVWFKSVSGLDGDGAPRGVAFYDYTIRSHRCLAVPDLTGDERFRDNPLVVGPQGLRSYGGAPLLTPDGYNVGSLCVMDRRPHAFSDDELHILSRFAALVVEQLELRTLASQDYLTGCLSRRAFIDAVQGSVRHFSRDGRPLSLISFDIDHFKAVNDRFGHSAGDRVLKAVADACRS
jgi:GAF domain-containing protein